MKSRLALLAVPFLALACTDAEQATLLEPPAISADVTISAPALGVFNEVVRYWWSTCSTLAVESGGDWTYPNDTGPSQGCLIAQVNISGGGPVTKGQVVWQVCKSSRKGMVQPKATCDGGGFWAKFRGGVKVDASGEAAVSTFGTLGCGTGQTAGYRYIFKGGGQIKSGTSTPFDATNTTTC